MSVTNNMSLISRAMGRTDGAATVAELADLSGLTVSQTRTALQALERRGEVQQLGVAQSGGRCWGSAS